MLLNAEKPLSIDADTNLKWSHKIDFILVSVSSEVSIDGIREL